MATSARFWAAQFTDGNGNPYAGVKVYHYTSGTTSDLDVYRDKGKSTADTQPVLGDSQGVVWFYGDGNYRLRIVSSADILLYDWEDVQITGTRSGTPKAIVFYGSDNEQTEDTSFLFDSANDRMAIGTTTNLTERLVLGGSGSFMGVERTGANSAEGAIPVVGLNSSDKVSVDPRGVGTVWENLTKKGLLYLDANGQLSVLTLINGQIPIGSVGSVPVAALPTAGTGIAITGTAGDLNIEATGVSVYNRTPSVLEVVSSTTETDVYSFSITGGTLDSSKAMMVTLIGDYLNDSGSARTMVIKAIYGTTTLYADTTATLATGATRRAVLIRLILGSQGSTSAQILGGEIFISEDAGATTGLGDLATTGGLDEVQACVYGSASEDSTTNLNFRITITHSANAATISFRRQYANAMLL